MSQYCIKTLGICIAKRVLIIALIALLITSIGTYYITSTFQREYTEGLTAHFQIKDYLTDTVVTDAEVYLYRSTADPFQLTFNEEPIQTATYDAQTNKWSVNGDAGSYKLLIVKDGYYPELIDVAIPPSTKEEKGQPILEVNLNPYTINITKRATAIYLYIEIYAYDRDTRTYSIPDYLIDPTQYYKWKITITYTVKGDPTQVINGGRFYITEITNLQLTKAYIDNARAEIFLDDTIGDDGLTGYYIDNTLYTWTGGTTHTLTLYIEKTDLISQNSLSILLYEYYQCHNKDLRWWPDYRAIILIKT